MNIYAIVPARSGSKRFRHKNIKIFRGIPLFQHSINFAKKLDYINKIILTSDSQKYLNKAIKNKKLILHKRSNLSSKDTSMEEDILFDLKKFFYKKKIEIPDYILWLRPTHPLRCIKTFKNAFKLFRDNKFKSVMVVHKSESRLFKVKDKYLVPINSAMNKKSMIRSQDTKPLYSIFSGEFFKFPKKKNKKFLGSKKLYIKTTKYTNFDLDDKIDLKILQNTVKSNMSFFKKYLHDK